MRIKILLCSLCFIPLTLNAKNTINWVYSDFPPAYILKGEYKNQGYAQLTQSLVKQYLPEFTHTSVKANYGRSALLISKNNNYCHAALLKTTERQKYIEYSQPVYLLLDNRLFVKQKSLFKVKPYIKNTVVDLNALLNSENFTLAITKGSIYGESIDKTILNNKNSFTVYERTAEDHFAGLSQLLALDNRQIDGFIGYPTEAFYVAKSNNQQPHTSFTIKGAKNYQLGFIGCSKTNFGKYVISKINKVISEHKSPLIDNFYKKWLSKEQINTYEVLLNDMRNPTP